MHVDETGLTISLVLRFCTGDQEGLPRALAHAAPRQAGRGRGVRCSNKEMANPVLSTCMPSLWLQFCRTKEMINPVLSTCMPSLWFRAPSLSLHPDKPSGDAVPPFTAAAESLPAPS